MCQRTRLLFSIAVSLSLPSTAIFGDDTTPVSDTESSYQAEMNAKIVSLEQQIDWLRSSQTSSAAHHHKASDTVDGSGLYAGAEVSFLRPYLSGARSSNTGTGGKWIEPSYATGIRYQLGYQNDEGLGIRARYFSLNHGADLAGVFGGGSVGINLDAVDAEVTFRDQLGHWDAQVSGGIRYGQLTYTGDGVVIFPGHISFEGVGPTVAFDARRKLGDSGLSLFGNLRGSFLIGEIRNGQPVTGLAAGSVEDEIVHVIDNQLGIAWTFVEECNYTLELRAAWETQFWLNDTLADDVFGIGTNLALSGPALALELRY